MYLFRIFCHKSHINFHGTEVRSAIHKYIPNVHTFNCYFGCTGHIYVICDLCLSGIDCNVHLPRYKMLQSGG
jgi:hypothetical protein